MLLFSKRNPDFKIPFIIALLLIVSFLFSDLAAVAGPKSVNSGLSELPPPNITPAGPVTFCKGGFLVVTGQTAGTTYQWQLTNNNIPGATNDSLFVNSSGTYTCIVTTGGNSSTLNSVIVTVNSISLTAASTSVCNGSSTTLTASGITTGTYNWINPASASGSTATVTPAGPSTTYSVAGTANGCLDTATITVSVKPNPIASFTSSPNSGCPRRRRKLQFNSTSSANGSGSLNYLWNFGDPNSGTNNTSNSQNPDHSFVGSGFSTSGTFTVTLTVTGANGCSANTQQTVNIGIFPDASLSSSANVTTFNGEPYFSICTSDPSASIDFFNASTTTTTNTNYQIIWGDNTPGYNNSTFATPESHTYSVGTYVMTFIVSSSGCKDTTDYNVFVGSNPVVGLGNPGGTGICTGNALTFPITYVNALGITNTPGTIYTITFNDGSAPVIFTHPTNGVPQPSITHIFDSTSCGTVSSNGTINYNNSFSASISASNPCQSSSAGVVPIYVSQKPDASFTTSPGDTICQNSTITFTNTSQNGNSVSNGQALGNCTNGKFVWKITPATGWNIASGSLGNDFNSNNPNPWITGSSPLQLTFTVPGTYNIKIKTGGNTTCGIDSAERIICVTEIPTASFTLNTQTGCAPLQVNATGSTNAATCGQNTYSWSVTYTPTSGCLPNTENYVYLGGTNASSANPQFQFINPGVYTIGLVTISPAQACSSTVVTQQVTVKGKPVVAIGNVPASICTSQSITPTSNNTCYITGSTTYLWTFAGGTPATSNVANPGTPISFTGIGSHNISLQVTNECGSTTNSTTLSLDTVSTSNAGPAITRCGNSVTMAANTPVFGTGTWVYASGPSGYTITNPGSPTTTITGLVPGTYVFSWSIANNNCSSSSNVTINISSGPSTAVAGPDQDLCLLTTASLSATAPAVGTGTWTQVGGAPATITNPAAASTTVTGLAVGVYDFQWTVTFSNCTPSTDIVRIRVLANPSIAAAGSDQVICASSATMAANTAVIGTGVWTQVSGPSITTIANASSPTTSISGLVSGTYTFAWTISNGTCPPTSDNVSITVTQVGTTASAGNDIRVCDAASVTLAGNAATVGTGTWTFVSGPAGSTITTPANATSTVTGLVPGIYVFQWTITNGNCPPSSDNVQVVIDAAVTAAVAGPAQQKCGTSVTMAGNTATVGTGAWAQVSGPNSSTITSPTNPATTITGLVPGIYIFSWTITNGSCSSTSNVTITIFSGPSAAIAGPDQSPCLATSATLTATAPSVGTGAWTQLSGAPAVITTPASNTTTVTGLSVGVYQFVWSVSFSNCTPNKDTVRIEIFDNPTTSAAGNDQTICAATATMAANSPAVGTGTWTQASGPNAAVISNSNSPSTTMTGLIPGTYVFNWLITNGTCLSSVDQVQVNVSAIATTAAAGSDASYCNQSSITLAGNTPAVGTGAWTLVSGPAGSTITTPAAPNSTVTGLIPGSTYTFQWTITNGVCPPSTDQVIVSVLVDLTNIITAPVTLICSGQTVSINGDVPTGGTGSYSYQWQQSADGISWTDIVGANSQNYTSGPLATSTYFRRKVTSLPCEKFSNIIFIEVQPGISNNLIASNQGICINTTCPPLTGSTPSGGNNVFSYQWQVSTDGGISWTDITGATGISYSPGVLTDTIQFRRLVSTTLCSGPQANVSNIVTIIVYPDAIATFTVTDSVACAPFILQNVITPVAYPNWNQDYNWYADGSLFGTNTTGVFPGYTMNNQGDTIDIKLVTTSPNGCKPDSTQHTFITVRTAFAQFIKDTTGGCGPLIASFTNTSNIIDNSVQFFWFNGPTLFSTAVNPPPVTFLSSPFFVDTTYYITLKAYNGCDTTIWRDSIRILANPKANFTVSSTSGCSPFTIQVTNNSLGNNTSYYWDFGNGDTDTTTTNGTFSYTYYTSVVDTFALTLIAENQCKRDTQVINIRVAPNTITPGVQINSSELFGCVSHTVNFSNNTTGATSFTWDFGDSSPLVTTSAFQFTVPHTYTTAGTFTVAIAMTNGCSDTTVFKQVTVYPRPVAAFTTNQQVYCLGDTTRVTNTSQDATNYIWNWGSGPLTSGFQPNHIYTASGNYTILLRAERTNANGVVCYDTASRPVTVLNKPDSSILTNINNTNCAPFTLNATAPGIINETVNWYVYDTTVPNYPVVLSGPSLTYTFNNQGTFEIHMIAENAAGCKDSSKRVFYVYQKPVAGFTPLNLATCDLDTLVSYSNTTTANNYTPLTYHWLVNGVQQSTSGNFSYNYTNVPPLPLPRTFNTTLIATNSVGCADSITGTLQMNPTARSLFTVNNPAACIPFVADISNNATDATDYAWYLNGVLVSNNAVPSITIPAANTNYTITLIVSNNFACRPDTSSFSFTSRVMPKAVFSLNNSLGCTGQLNIVTVNNSTNANAYDWDWGDGSAISTLTNPTHLYTSVGTYRITLTAKDGVCQDTSSRLVVVADKPIVDFIADNERVCDTALVRFTNLTSNADTYHWTFSNGQTSTDVSPTISFLPSNTPYTVQLVASNAAGCRDSLTKANYIRAFVRPDADFTILPSATISIPNYTFSFTNLTANSSLYRYLWFLGDGSFANTRDVPPHLYADTGSYPVQLIVLDTSNNCRDTIIKIARIEGFPGYLYVPNAFYPNSIQTTFKTFKPLGKGLEEYELQIFDSWGKLLFKTTRLDAGGSPVDGWDGTFNGKQVPQDAYAWRIKAKYRNGRRWEGMVYNQREKGAPGQTFGTVTLFR